MLQSVPDPHGQLGANPSLYAITADLQDFNYRGKRESAVYPLSRDHQPAMEVCTDAKARKNELTIPKARSV